MLESERPHLLTFRVVLIQDRKAHWLEANATVKAPLTDDGRELGQIVDKPCIAGAQLSEPDVSTLVEAKTSRRIACLIHQLAPVLKRMPWPGSKAATAWSRPT